MDQQKILFVDDEEQIRRLLSSFLTRRGYLVQTAVDGQEALNFLERERPDLVITDVNMPNVDGVELTRRLRADPRHESLPIIMLSAKVQTDEILAGYAEGADEYVPKPIEMRILAAKVESLLRRVSHAAVPAAVETVAAPEPPAKQVVVFMHGKGGVGTTTLAVNMAVALATEAGKSVSLVDLDLAYGNAARMLGLHTERTLADLAADDHINLDALREITLEHQSGVKVVVGCDQPEHSATVGGLLVRWTIEQELERSDVVIVDTASWLSEATLAALPEATTVCVVTAPRLVALEATANCLAMLRRLGVKPEQTRLMLNNTSSRGLKSDVVARRLERPVDLSVPYLASFGDAARTLKPLDKGQPDEVGAIVARDLAHRVISFPAA
ncbi:MAG: response regulator [Chloroflexi bacterium]|nr:response regulator [Chloroflexota bacterium]